MKLLAPLSFLVLFAASCSSPKTEIAPPTSDFEVRAVLSANQVVIGEVADLHVEIFHPEGTSITLPTLDRPPEIIIRGQNRKTDLYKAGMLRTTEDLKFMSLRPGVHLVSTGLVTRVSSADHSITNQPLPALRIEVRSTLAAASDALKNKGEELGSASGNTLAPERIMPVRNQIHVPPEAHRRLLTLLWVVLGIAAVLAALGWLVARISARPGPVVQGPPPPPPHVLALRELEELKTHGWIERGESEPFFVSISGILRRYLEGRFNVRAPEMTTEEFIESTATSNVLTSNQQSLMQEFLLQSDLVKFARHAPAPQILGEAYDTGVRFVHETAEVPLPSSGATP